MNPGHRIIGLGLAVVALLAVASTASAQNKEDVFKGKLFAPNVILENQAELGLSKEQYTKIRAAVVEVQANVAEHEWDMREAYQSIMAELDKMPIDEDRVLREADRALIAENQVKKQQMAMLVRLKNLLTKEQIAVLQDKEKR